MPINILLSCCFTTIIFALPLRAQETMRQWEVFEITLIAETKYNNPYALIPVNTKDGLIKTEFKGVDGKATGKTVAVYGFWDGGQRWKVRFAPPQTGVWEYTTISRDRGLNNKQGRFTVVDWQAEDKATNQTRRGFITVAERGQNPGHTFQYSDGTPFLWIADTWWNWTNRRIKFASYKRLVDDRASKGFNIGQLFVAANGWGKESSLLDASYSVLDVDHMKKIDSMIVYANSKGITVWVHGWWSRENLNLTAGEEKIKRWWRYLIHRLSAYNVIWVVAGEYNMFNYGGLGLPFWKDLGAFVKHEDPYDRITGIHNTPPGWDGGAEAPQWSTAEVIHDAEWLDYNQSQVGHGRWYNEMIPGVVAEAYSKTPAKPVVVTEPWYEFVEGNPTGQDIRFGAWAAILSGAAGHTYGGGHIWLAHTPDSPMGGGPWPLETDFNKNTLDYPGAVSMQHMAGFFKKTSWWALSPHPEMLSEYPDKYCLALAGEEYIIYLRWGGGVKVDLRPSEQSDIFEYYWFNPANGKYYQTRSVKGGAITYFSAPESYPGVVDFKDWVLYIRNRSHKN
jgi:hypothetical protein